MSAPEHPTRQAVLFAASHAAMHETGLSMDNLAANIAARYCARVPHEHRALNLTAEPSEPGAEAYYQWKDRTRRRIERYLNSDVNLPVELEEAWLDALPEPHRSTAISHLCHRIGILPVAIPEMDEHTAATLSEVMREGSEAVAAASPMVEDGRLGENDRPHAGKAYREAVEAAASYLRWAQRLETAFPEEVCGRGESPEGVVQFPGQEKAG